MFDASRRTKQGQPFVLGRRLRLSAKENFVYNATQRIMTLCDTALLVDSTRGETQVWLTMQRRERCFGSSIRECREWLSFIEL